MSRFRKLTDPLMSYKHNVRKQLRLIEAELLVAKKLRKDLNVTGYKVGDIITEEYYQEIRIASTYYQLKVAASILGAVLRDVHKIEKNEYRRHSTLSLVEIVTRVLMKLQRRGE